MTAEEEVAQAGAPESPEPSLVPEVYEAPSGEAMPYRQYLPPVLPEGRKVPLVFFLHGAGERGTDNASQLVHGVKPILRYCRGKGLPIALVAPQCPLDGQWVDTDYRALAHRMALEPTAPLKMAMALLEDRCEALPVDRDRIYLTGLSMGGYATWELLQRCPGLFAAAMPVCGGGDTTLAWRMRDVPIWAFHGAVDSVVPVDRSRQMVSALWTCGGKIRYTEFPGVDHAAWVPAYDDPVALEWLFSQKKG